MENYEIIIQGDCPSEDTIIKCDKCPFNCSLRMENEDNTIKIIENDNCIIEYTEIYY